ncbi:hypothetical protein ABEH00_00785 [Pantoea agglomerans]|jgi:toxic protein SymE|uniref:hypothetical protein n=1 Tax=Pantoea TaxID=53335 RepID=UPI001654B959|nr:MULTISPECIES: hypothetical protein [Pantoea]UVV72774.1 hypothetical protein NYF24_18600 [Pantoea agglomerans]
MLTSLAHSTGFVPHPLIAACTGTQLNVRVLPDCLILTVKPSSAEPEVIQALRQLCPKLSARKQREQMDVIQVMAKPKKRAGN